MRYEMVRNLKDILKNEGIMAHILLYKSNINIKVNLYKNNDRIELNKIKKN